MMRQNRTGVQAWLGRILLLGVLLVAFGVRAHHLDFQSLWSDEGISLLRSSLPLGQMLAEMPTEHVPGYFVLLHFWLQLVGTDDFAIRFFSLWPSLLSVALVYRLALALVWHLPFAFMTGLAASAFLATSAFQVWYAQEARMYSWLLAASLLSTLFFWRVHFSPKGSARIWPAWFGYVLSTTLTIYLHYYGFLLPMSQSVLALILLARHRHWQRFGLWVLAGATIALLFVPWLPRAIQLFAFAGWREGGDPWSLPWRYLTAYTVGESMPAPWATWLPWGYLGLAAVGVVGWWRQRADAAIFLLVSLLLPFALIFLQALTNPDFHERYAIALSAPLLLLAGGGVAFLSNLLTMIVQRVISRFHRLRGFISFQSAPSFNFTPAIYTVIASLLLLPLLYANGTALQRLYADTSLHKPDFRSAAQRIAQSERRGDVILVDGPDPQKVFLHYYKGASPVHDLRHLIDASGDEIVHTLTTATQDATRVWEVLYFHEPAAVQHWLALTAWATDPSYHNNIRVTLYGLPGPPMMTQGADVAFGPSLTLMHIETSSPVLSPGDLLRVTTAWQVHQPPPDYKFSLRLLAEDGSVVLAQDYIPQNWFGPTSTWPVDGVTTDQHGFIIPPDLAVGRYAVALRLYDPMSGLPVETPRGQDVTLTEIDVVAEIAQTVQFAHNARR